MARRSVLGRESDALDEAERNAPRRAQQFADSEEDEEDQYEDDEGVPEHQPGNVLSFSQTYLYLCNLICTS